MAVFQAVGLNEFDELFLHLLPLQELDGRPGLGSEIENCDNFISVERAAPIIVDELKGLVEDERDEAVLGAFVLQQMDDVDEFDLMEIFLNALLDEFRKIFRVPHHMV